VPLQLIDLLGSNPFPTPRETERRLGVAYNTVMRAITALEKGGVLTKVGENKRDRVFCARAILDILEEPARLVPEPPVTKRRATQD
jgi:DNA-binding MarR family transcriptional regulator